MKQFYEVEKNVEKLKRGSYTNFITPNIFKEITSFLKDDEYFVYYPYFDCDKVILYTYEIPKIRLLEIESSAYLTHSSILGSLFGLNISNEVFGDIVVVDDKYYFYVMDEIGDYILNNLLMVGNKSVKVKEVSLDSLKNYQRKYDIREVIVSSLRIDNVIAKIVGISRDTIKNKIKNKEILLNYEILNNGSYGLKENDVFSIRKLGKYKFLGVAKKTKKDNYIVKYSKYL